MDRTQMGRISSASQKLCDRMDFFAVSEFLLEQQVLKKDKIDEIKTKAESRYCRNLKLLSALQESSSSTVFDDFIYALEKTNQKEALKELVSDGSRDLGRSPLMSSSSLYKVTEKFMNSKPSQYPIGMLSGKTSKSSSSCSSNCSLTGECLGKQENPSLSKLKERHQATLVSSRGGTVSSCQTSDHTRDFGCQLNRHNSEGENCLRTTSGSQSSGLANQNSGYQLRRNQTSQTPRRQDNSSRLLNLSISDGDDYSNDEDQSDTRGRGDTRSVRSNEEPIVCWHPYAQSQQIAGQSAVASGSSGSAASVSRQGSRAASPAHCCHTSYYSSSSAGSDSDASSESLVLDSNLNLDPEVTRTLVREGSGATSTMSIQKATIIHTSDGDYKMTARPRGVCLIVNNIDFESDIFPQRKGSDEDARRFDTIFKQLGFLVILKRNQAADQMRELFKEISSKCKKEHDALFVIILSHGNENGVYGTDGIEVNLEQDVIACFDNRNCQQLVGKPKVFVIQACRGRAKDCGGDGDTTDSVACSPPLVTCARASGSSQTTSDESGAPGTNSQANRIPFSWLPSGKSQEGATKLKHPVRSDMLLVFACLAGYVSVRNELAGSWLGVALAYYLMSHAHNKHLQDILNMVTRDVIQRESSHGHIQSIELKFQGWTKKLYFNPYYYDDSRRLN